MDLVEARASSWSRCMAPGSIRVAARSIWPLSRGSGPGRTHLARQAWDQARTALGTVPGREGPVPQAHTIPQLVTDAVYWQVVLLGVSIRTARPRTSSSNCCGLHAVPAQTRAPARGFAFGARGLRNVSVRPALEMARGRGTPRCEPAFVSARWMVGHLLKSSPNTFSSLHYSPGARRHPAQARGHAPEDL